MCVSRCTHYFIIGVLGVASYILIMVLSFFVARNYKKGLNDKGVINACSTP